MHRALYGVYVLHDVGEGLVAAISHVPLAELCRSTTPAPVVPMLFAL